MQAGLGCAVGECLESWYADSVDTPDVDDARGVCGRGSSGEEGREELGQGEDAGQVEREDAGPGCFGKLLVGSAPV